MHHGGKTEKYKATPLIQPDVVCFGDETHAEEGVRVFSKDFFDVSAEEGGGEALLAEVGLDDDGVNAQGRAVGVVCAHGVVLQGGACAESPVDKREQFGSVIIEEAEEEGAGLGLPEEHAVQGGGFIL